MALKQRLTTLITILTASTVHIWAQAPVWPTDYPQVHDPVVACCDGTWYLFATGFGVDILSSQDLVTWDYAGRVFEEAPKWAVESVPGYRGHTWAPDILFRDGVYYAMLVCKQGGDLTMVDARPSDAIAIAVRKGCEIYAYESVMEEAGIIMEDMEKESPDENEESTINKGVAKTSLDLLDLETLEDLLQEAVDNEDYQKAAQIRDEINRRK